MSKMATIQMGSSISAQGTVVEAHGNGEVTIDTYSQKIRGVPIGMFPAPAQMPAQNNHTAS